MTITAYSVLLYIVLAIFLFCYFIAIKVIQSKDKRYDKAGIKVIVKSIDDTIKTLNRVTAKLKDPNLSKKQQPVNHLLRPFAKHLIVCRKHPSTMFGMGLINFNHNIICYFRCFK